MIKRVNFNSDVIWIVIVLFFSVITGTAIADTKWVYFGIVLIPFILYICIKKPFIFPFGLYVFLLPFNAVLALTGSAKGATLTKFLGILVILVLSLKGAFEKRLKQPDYAAVWMVLFVLYGALSMLWAIDGKIGLEFLRTTTGLLILYLVSKSYQIDRSEYETLK